jgi:hypothetical protein
MLVAGQTARLGITGYPPHVSMYLTVLRISEMRACRDGVWGFGAPTAPDWAVVWQAGDQCITASAARPLPIADLFAVLRLPPFGLREGVLSVVALAAVLARRREIALYEGGVFSPDLRMESIERLVRSPQRFALRRPDDSGSLTEVVANLAAAVDARRTGGESSFLAVVRELVTPVSQLEPYARRTRRFPSPAPEIVVGMRAAILGATDPSDLVTERLPAAVGVDPSAPGGQRRFAEAMAAALTAMRLATSRLLA